MAEIRATDVQVSKLKGRSARLGIIRFDCPSNASKLKCEATPRPNRRESLEGDMHLVLLR